MLIVLSYRRRHLRCPGEKPACSRCQRANRPCQYATEQSKQIPTAKIQVRFKKCEIGKSSPVSSPRFKSELERLGFDCFQSRSAESLGPAFGWPEWGRIVLQLSEQDTAVRHALIGLGAIHDHHFRTNGFHFISYNHGLLDFSYCQYGKALRQLRTRIQSLDGMSPTAAMLICILFAIFDFLHGDDQAAAAHLKAGVAMLRIFVAGTDLLHHISSDPSPLPMESPQRHLQNCFVKAFSHLDFFSLW